MVLAAVTPATEPMFELRYKPELAIAISDSSTEAARSTNTAEPAMPVAKPPKQTNSACHTGVWPCQVVIKRVKQHMALSPERIRKGLYRPVLHSSENVPRNGID
jgi:hypothetical protein